LKIALTVDPEIAVPPLHYGGIERIVDFLVTEYLKEGHTVHLFANSDSRNDCVRKIWPGKSVLNKADILKNTLFLTKNYITEKYDVVHSFSRLAYLSLVLPLGAKCIMSYQREPTLGQIAKAGKLALKNNLWFTGCSNYISNQIKSVATAFTVYNGVPLPTYQFNPAPDPETLIFLGRIEPIKGTHLAIEVAKKTNKKLIIAGNIPHEYQNYFDKQIKPELNERITYVGSVNDRQKNELLGNAAAFLMPIEWDEPFGIVMTEAMACGTPVIGLRRGAVPEVVKNEKTGYICNNIDELIQGVERIGNIDRSLVRKDLEERFSSTVIAGEYLSLYHQFIQ
jgi:glycosyltransferase involved in cell wall biosynthesis